jgi:hypothetical protein
VSVPPPGGNGDTKRSAPRGNTCADADAAMSKQPASAYRAKPLDIKTIYM